MQVFILSEDPEENASWYMDKHVVKTPAYIVQLLINACARRRIKFPALKNAITGLPLMPSPSVMNHSLTKWASLTPANFNYFLEIGLDLCKEYKLRFHDLHYCTDYFLQFEILEDSQPEMMARYPWIIPMAFKNLEAGLVASYRNYYIEAKNHLAVWSPPRDVPPWFPLDAVLEGRKIAQGFRLLKTSGSLTVDGVELTIRDADKGE